MYEGEQMTATLVAGADLSTMQYKVIVVAGTIAASNGLAAGVLLNKPQSGEAATIAYAGRMKAYAAAAIAKGLGVMVTTSGFLTTVTSGSSSIGRALDAANSGDLFPFVGNFNTVYVTASGG